MVGAGLGKRGLLLSEFLFKTVRSFFFGFFLGSVIIAEDKNYQDIIVNIIYILAAVEF